jgi:hypothetical protein
MGVFLGIRPRAAKLARVFPGFLLRMPSSRRSGRGESGVAKAAKVGRLEICKFVGFRSKAAKSAKAANIQGCLRRNIADVVKV